MKVLQPFWKPEREVRRFARVLGLGSPGKGVGWLSGGKLRCRGCRALGLSLPKIKSHSMSRRRELLEK